MITPQSQMEKKEAEDPGDQSEAGKPALTIAPASPAVPQAPSLLQTIRTWVADKLRPSSDTLKETLEQIIEEHEEEDIKLTPESRDMLNNILYFGQLKVSDLMVPRAQIVAVEENATLEEVTQIILKEEHTRMPVYRKTLDEVIGFLHIKDLIKAIVGGEPFTVKELVRDILIVPPSKRVIDLLVNMRLSGMHMALVVDEYGGTDGLVTLEDMFEEIVGDIHDEHDEDLGLIRQIEPGVYEADATIEIEDLEKALNGSFEALAENEDFDTLGGLIFVLTGKVPQPGESVTYEDLRFDVMDADLTRIKKVRITRVPATA